MNNELRTDILNLMTKYASLNRPEICRHSVMLDLLMLLDVHSEISQHYVKLLAKSCCDATTLLDDGTTGDDQTIKHIKTLMRYPIKTY